MAEFVPINISDGHTAIHPFRMNDMKREKEFLSEVFAIYGDPENMKFMPEKLIKSKDDLPMWMFKVINGYDKKGYFTHFVSAVSLNRVIGIIDIIPPMTTDNYVGVSGHWFLEYALIRAGWGKGIMSSAVGAVATRLKQQGINKLAASTWPANKGSVRVLEKAGFVKQGKFDDYQDLYIYAG